MVEAALPPDIRGADEAGVFMHALADLANAGDADTRAALAVLVQPVNDLAARGGALAHQEFLSAIDSLAKRCAIVGSPALQ